MLKIIGISLDPQQVLQQVAGRKKDGVINTTSSLYWMEKFDAFLLE